MTTPDPDAIQARASDPGASVWVAASAGTGKTKVLSDRVLRLMLTGTDPRRILCLTFTRAAAAEMATRIARILGEWATIDDSGLDGDLTGLLGHAPDQPVRKRARRLFARVLDIPGGLPIQTLHAFCQSLLRRFPLEAKVAPHFQVMDERDAAEMLVQARESVLLRARAGRDPALSAALATVTALIHETTFSELMATLAGERGRLRRLVDAHGSVAATEAAIRGRLGVGPDDTPESVTAAAGDDDAFDGLGLRLAVSALEQGSDADRRRAAVLADWLAAGPAERAAGFDSYRAVFLTQTGEVRKTLMTRKAAGAAAGALAVMEGEAERLVRAVARRKAAALAQATAALLTLGHALLESYRTQKEARALLDYDDLILRTRRLLAEDAVPWVLFKLDGGIEHVLIDEAQDTNPDQWAVVEALSAEFFAGLGTRETARTVFAVGDAKQSIYSFQGADPAAFRTMRALFENKATDAGQEWRAVPMTISFRSTPAVLAAVDAVFARDEAADGVSLDGEPIRHQAFRADDAGLVEVWPPEEPAEADALPAWKPPVERYPGDTPQGRLARKVAARIKAMVAGREILVSQGRPIRPGDVMVLVRRRTGFVEDLVRELKREGVEVAGVDRMVLTGQLAVMDLVALGRFLLLPGDDLTLATVLKGPLVGLDEEQLFRLAWNRPGSLWDSLRRHAAADPVFAAAATELADLLGRADYTPPFELFGHVLGPRRGREKLLGRLGSEADDPLAEFLDQALAFERAHPPSLEGFLHWLEAGRIEIKRDLEHGTRDAVRVMTVHGAKGLQAPIVFLPDTLQMPRQSPRLLWPDGLMLWPPRAADREAVTEAEKARLDSLRDQETRRLLYVALTRAEDRLYVCGWTGRQTPPDDCWYNLIRRGLDGVADEVADGGGGTVWRLTSPQRRTVAVAEVGPDAAAFEETVTPSWLTRPPPPEQTPPRPLAPSHPDEDEPPVRSPLGTDDGARFRRGRLIHRLLEALPSLPPARRAAAARDVVARPVHGLDEAARAALVAEVLAVIEAPAHAALFGPGSLAEVPLVGRVGARVVSGQVDRLVVTDDAVMVVDYKTNRPPPARPDDVAPLYCSQMAAYRALLADIYPGRRIDCLLLWTDGPRLMVLPDRLLAHRS